MKYIICWKHRNAKEWIEEEHPSFSTRLKAKKYLKDKYGVKPKVYGVSVRTRIVKRKGRPDY